MQTPHLPQSIFGSDFQRVYEPAEDTFLLLDALENDLNSLRDDKTRICLECGSGSGTILTALSKALNVNGKTSSLMIATDINEYACKTTRKCADLHQQTNIQIVRTNLAESLVDRLENSVDLLVFNPPYVPTEENEDIIHSGQLQFSWAGGNTGRRLIDVFLKSFVPRLLSKPHGVAYMVALQNNNIAELSDYLVPEYGIQGTSVMERRAGTEFLHVLKYSWVA